MFFSWFLNSAHHHLLAPLQGRSTLNTAHKQYIYFNLFYPHTGNHFALGGSVRGGRILGEYPSDLSPDGPVSLRRGRMIPTTSWEAVYNGVAEWMGVTTPEELDKVLPNRGNFRRLYTGPEMFG